MDEIKDIWGGVNILVNNAEYFLSCGRRAHDGIWIELNQIATNYLGPVGMINLALPHVRELGRGKIINVSVSPAECWRCRRWLHIVLQKYALEGFSEALWY